MGQPVEQGDRHALVAEDFRPLSKLEIFVSMMLPSS
jgi:hypothetical protein